MKRRILGISVSIVSAVLLILSCNRKSDPIGPEYFVAPADFSVKSFTLPSDSLNFRVEKCTINAEFSHKVSWTLTFKGNKTGAVMTYTGASDAINSSVLLWNGVHKDLYFFKKEDVTVTLTFFGSEIVKTGKVFIKGTRNYAENPMNVYLAKGDSNGYEKFLAGNTLNNFGSFGAQFTFEQVAATTRRVIDTSIALEGNKVFQINGSDGGGFFIGGMQHRRKRTAPGIEPYFFDKAGWTPDPSKIYYNIFVYGTGQANARMNLEFHEADLSSNSIKPISAAQCASGGAAAIDEHSPCFDDAYIAVIDISHTGWKMFSVRYSDMTKSAVANNGNNGNGVMEPNRVHRIQIGVNTTPNNNSVNAIWDFPIITYGGPFDPTK
ncbi:MAG: hypothetical protein MUF42_02125 [Cytophagaceae bacterium]|jgi:hypothetical protein|nr:hypothetical protein [Cytophagaceae bacterium]